MKVYLAYKLECYGVREADCIKSYLFDRLLKVSIHVKDITPIVLPVTVGVLQGSVWDQMYYLKAHHILSYELSYYQMFFQ